MLRRSKEMEISVNSIVLELQQECLDPDKAVSDLCRKALLIATKLSLDTSWLTLEVEGYPAGPAELVPEYRHLINSPIAINALGRHIPVMLDDTMKQLKRIVSREPIAVIESTYNNIDGNYLYIEPPTDLQQTLQRVFQRSDRFIFRTSPAEISKLLENVKNRILNFSLELEKQGIMGEGMTFKKEEKNAARNISISVGGNFTGSLGDVINSTLTQTITIQKNDLEALKTVLEQNNVSKGDIGALEAAIQQDGDVVTEPNKFGQNVRAWMVSMFNKAAEGTWNVNIAAAGNILALALNHYYFGM